MLRVSVFRFCALTLDSMSSQAASRFSSRYRVGISGKRWHDIQCPAGSQGIPARDDNASTLPNVSMHTTRHAKSQTHHSLL
jgi:hypothetical protein